MDLGPICLNFKPRAYSVFGFKLRNVCLCNKLKSDLKLENILKLVSSTTCN